MSITSDFYLARAADSAREAAETTLENVRQRNLRSEEVWRSMAERLLKGEQARQAAAASRIEERVA
jgi:hypothetical protein